MVNHRSATNYYDVLEVAPNAIPSEIHKAYQRAKSTYSQDNPALYSMFSREEARDLLQLIEEAYSVLGNQALRRAYDDSLSSPQAQNSPPEWPGSIPPAAPSSEPGTSASARSEHETLPDFLVPDPSIPESLGRDQTTHVDPPFHRPSQHAPAGLASGSGRTSLSTYALDAEVEAEIHAAEDFDGALLQRIRLYKNIGLDRLSEATRVSRSYLMAVENDDFKSLPAAVFVRGFVVQMARIYGLDEPKVTSSYMKRFKAGSGR